ncbi:EpsG family protein [Rahnella inusitata]|uniref:EpsG family protein n=1 Tax=Rahnella inusitata TaxID=58169 RepID=UPI0039BDFEA1
MYLFSNSIVFLFFLVHIILLALALAIAVTSAKKADDIGVVIIFCAYCLLNFSRNGYGVDEPVYLDAYKDYLKDGTLYFEYSFNFIYLVFSKLDVEPVFFNHLFSVLFIFLAVLMIKKSVNKPYQSLGLVFFLFFSITLDFVFNAYRQGMAFLFIAISLCYFFQNHKKRAILFFIIGLGFHWSSIVVALAVILRKFLSFKNAVRLNILIFIMTTIAMVIPLHIIPLVTFILSKVSFVSPYILKITGYLDSPIAYFYDLNFMGRLPMIASVLAMLSIFYIYRKVIPQFFYKIVMILMLYCLSFLEMSYSFRNYYWVLPFLPIIMANIPEYLNSAKGKKSALVIVSVLHMMLAITGYYTSGIMPLIFL